LFLTFLAAAPAQAAPPAEPTYWKDIRPVFRRHCTACHSAKNLREVSVSGGLALDSYEAVRKGTAKRDANILHQVLVTTDVKKRMPLDGIPVPAETAALVKRWIDTGAKEGVKPDDGPEVAVKKTGPRRRLDVVLATTATPPAKALGNAKPGKLDLALKIGPLAPVTAVVFSPDGKLLASGSYGQVTVWDVAAGKPVKVLT